MSLGVHTFVYDADGGHDFLEDPEDSDTLAGFESTRTRLWGPEAIRALGSRLFPLLEAGELCVERDEIDDFLTECKEIRPHLGRLAEQGGYDAGYATGRLENIVAAEQQAKAEGGGIVVW
ncbi:hypothetical protein ABZ502_33610 [Streptomyces abikoensis]|uniref:hypothetical protein n=1 Tax=Streptomyces abikoensis TaxID=97398 RepID=UPI0033E29DF9